MTTIFRGARHFATDAVVDVVVDGGTITSVGPRAERTAGDIIAVDGLTVLPGLIDPHVHFRTPGDTHKEDWTTGSRAAARGGFTTVLDMPNTRPPTTDSSTANQKRQFAGASLVNYGLHYAVTRENLATLEGMNDVQTVKCYLGQSTGNLLVEGDLLDDLFVHLPNVLLLFHAEAESCLVKRRAAFPGVPGPRDHSTLRDRQCAVEALEHVLELVRIHQRPVYLCHVSTAEEVDLVRQAKEEGLPILAEVAPHHLFLDDASYDTLGMRAKVNPPLRTLHDRTVLLEALKAGIIDTVGTDHAPHLLIEKDQPYDTAAAGFPGLETALPLLLDAVRHGTLRLPDVVRAMAERPADIFGLGRKGRLEPGADADLTFIDPTLSMTIQNASLETKCGWSPFDGRSCTGWPVMTVVGGTVAYDRGRFSATAGTEVWNHA